MDIARFKQKPLMGIVRGILPEQAEPLLEAAISAGLETVEFTMNTPKADQIIRRARKVSKDMMLGAGTVLDLENLKSALDAGATFIVMPCLVPEVMEYCVKHKIPAFPGALTPSEIYSAWKSGATMVKVFPAKCFGPDYFKEIKGPFNEIELLACAGVTPQNMGEYFRCGASAISFGASVLRKEWLAAGDYSSISSVIKDYVSNLP
jgi:2-dehydro-3-deoxyphosphogluconate aldolase / (4S)-4-hydroxy-2-oxoglutarate aldolase